jgi:hypothetical protein
MKYLWLMLLIVLTSCSPPEQQRVNSNANLQACTVYSDRIECILNDNNIYYATTQKIAMVTKWDSSAWKENIFYCPKNLPLENITNTSIQCATQKICNNPNTNQLEVC